MRTVLPVLAAAGVLLAGCASGGDGGPAGGAAGAPDAESGILSGRLTAASATATHPLPVAREGHGRLAVLLQMKANLPQNHLEVNVTGPGGRAADADTAPFLYVFPGTRPVLAFGDPPAGAWQAAVALSGGVAADYEVHWCADAQERPGPQDNLACHRLY